MKSFTVFLCVIVYSINFCESKPTNDQIEELPRQTIAGTNNVMSATKAKLGSPECGSSYALPDDLRVVFAEVFGLPTAITFSGIFGILQFLKTLPRAIQESHGNLFYIFGCGLYRAVGESQYVSARDFVYYLNAAMKAADVKTQPNCFRYPEAFKNCPADAKSQLKAILLTEKRNIKNTLQDLGFYPASLVNAATRGATGAVNGALVGLSKGCYNGNAIDNAEGLTDSIVKGFGGGYADGVANGVALFQKINF